MPKFLGCVLFLFSFFLADATVAALLSIVDLVVVFSQDKN
jgi:hypothetical protein